jgi:Na+/H+ antiporter NhaC
MKTFFFLFLILVISSNFIYAVPELSIINDNETINEEPTKTERSSLIDIIIIVSFLLVIVYVLFGKKIIKT